MRRDVISEKKEDEVINEGDHVKMLEGDMKGEVLHVKGNKATVLFWYYKDGSKPK